MTVIKYNDILKLYLWSETIFRHSCKLESCQQISHNKYVTVVNVHADVKKSAIFHTTIHKGNMTDTNRLALLHHGLMTLLIH